MGVVMKEEIQERGYMYTQSCFTLLYSRNNIVKQRFPRKRGEKTSRFHSQNRTETYFFRFFSTYFFFQFFFFFLRRNKFISLGSKENLASEGPQSPDGKNHLEPQHLLHVFLHASEFDTLFSINDNLQLLTQKILCGAEACITEQVERTGVKVSETEPERPGLRALTGPMGTQKSQPPLKRRGFQFSHSRVPGAVLIDNLLQHTLSH